MEMEKLAILFMQQLVELKYLVAQVIIIVMEALVMEGVLHQVHHQQEEVVVDIMEVVVEALVSESILLLQELVVVVLLVIQQIISL